ncbi:sensor histidine kinase [Halocola ammonii]
MGFTTPGEEDSLARTQVSCMMQDHHGFLWIGTPGNGIRVFDGKAFHNYSTDNGLSSNFISTLIETSDSTIVVRTDKGLDVFTESGFESILHGTSSPLTIEEVIESEDKLWLATRQGLLVYHDKKISQFQPGNEHFSQPFYSVTKVEDGTLWAGGESELIRISPEGSYNVITSEFKMIGSIAEGDSSKIYFAPCDEGLQVLHEDSIRPVAGLQGALVSDVMDLGEKGLWCGTLNQGMAVLKDGEITFHNQQNGMRNNQVRCLLKDHWENLWVGTNSGVFRTIDQFVDKGQKVTAPKMLASNVQLFDKPLQETEFDSLLNRWGVPKDTLRFTQDQNQLGFYFEGIHLTHPHKVLYQWKLEGLQSDWSPLSRRNNITYSNLSPGKYTFRARSCLPNSDCTEAAPIHFVISTPISPTEDFYLIGGGALLVILLLIFILLISATKKKARLRNERITQENNKLELEQKALLLQLDPHFNFNTLNSIQELIAKNDKHSARIFLTQFSKLMKQTLENSRSSMITVKEEEATLKNYLELKAFTHKEKFSFSIRAAFDTENYFIPPLLIQPFVENAILRRVLPSPNPGRIEIHFAIREKILEVTITDNGIGRKPSNEKSQIQKSTGLEIAQERIELFAGDQVGEPIKTLDLKDDTGKSVGTRVVLQLPLKNQ